MPSWLTAKGRLLPSVIGAVGVTLWATETTLVNLAPRVPPLEIVALAFGFAALLTPIVWVITKENPFKAFGLPKRVWLLMVTSLVGYHACIYFATQRAPAAPAALLQGTTPLLIVLGSAFLPGERLRWWHLVGAGLGFSGVLLLINAGGSVDTHPGNDPIFYLSLIGVAAGLWGLYSVVTRRLADVPTSSLGMFYAASAVVALVAHFALESWIMPTFEEWLAIAALGILPMGLAIYFWDFGVKRGDIQALGVFSYSEPFIGAALVALVTGATLHIDFLWSGALVVAGAVVASASLWNFKEREAKPAIASQISKSVLPSVENTRQRLTRLRVLILRRVARVSRDETLANPNSELSLLLMALRVTLELSEELEVLDDLGSGNAAPSVTVLNRAA